MDPLITAPHAPAASAPALAPEPGSGPDAGPARGAGAGARTAALLAVAVTVMSVLPDLRERVVAGARLAATGELRHTATRAELVDERLDPDANLGAVARFRFRIGDFAVYATA
jgi:hypothetical protein